MFHFLQEHSDLGLFCDRFTFGFEDIKHGLDLVQKSCEGESLFVLVVQSIAISFCDSDATTRVALPTIGVVPEGFHILATILRLLERLNPLLGRLRLQVTLE